MPVSEVPHANATPSANATPNATSNANASPNANPNPNASDLAELVANVRLNIRAAVGILAGRSDEASVKAIDRLITAVRFLDVLERDLQSAGEPRP